MREAAGLVQIDHDDMRAAIQWLRKGGVLGIIMDQEPRRWGDAAIATGSAGHRGDLRPFRMSSLGYPEQAVAEDAAVFNGRLEVAVRARPDHWLWTYRRCGRFERQRAVSEVGSRGVAGG